MRNHLALASQYLADVLDGTIPACKWVRLACERQQRDLARQGTEAFPYVFDEASAVRFSKAIEGFKHYKGNFAGKHILLEPWQLFINAVAFGWVHQETGLRRFRSAYLCVPRKNGKSTHTAGIAHCFLTIDGEPGAEIYTGATTKDQARIVYNDAKVMALRNQGYCREFGVRPEERRIYVPETQSFIQAITKEGEANEGLNPHLAIIDELHAHKKRAVYDVLSLAMGARSEPMLWMITTAGDDLASVCYEIQTFTQQVLEEILVDETHCGFIWTVDEGEEERWYEPEIWVKANPNYGVSVNPADLAALATKAKASPSAQASFKTKRLNIWTAAGAQWMNMEKWRACGDSSLKLEDFHGKECWLAVDLASHVDINSLCFLFREGEQYACFFRFYLPEDTIRSGKNPHYQGWESQGWLTATTGDYIDFRFIEEQIKELSQPFQVVEYPYDQFKAQTIAQDLEQDGYPMVLIRQGPLTFSPAMKFLEGTVYAGKIAHDNNPVMTWMMSNVKAKKDHKDNVYPVKDREEQKIDGPVSLIMGISRAMAHQGPKKSKYETQGLATA
jgi:phage terminase large subunit-like protein